MSRPEPNYPKSPKPKAGLKGVPEPKRGPPPPRQNPGGPILPHEKPAGSTTTLFREPGVTRRGLPATGNPFWEMWDNLKSRFAKRKRTAKSAEEVIEKSKQSARDVYNALVIIDDDLDAHEPAQFDEINIRGWGHTNGEFHVVHDVYGPVFESSQKNILRFNSGAWIEIVFDLAAAKTSKDKRAKLSEELNRWSPLDEHENTEDK